MIGLLVVTIVFLLGRLSRTPYGSLSDPYGSAQYKRIWASEENELWTWLEERVGLENSAPAILPSNSGDNRRKERVFDRNAKDMQRKLSNEKMNERQVIEAIEITRQRLEVLEEAVRRNNPGSTTKGPKESKGEAPQPV